MSYYYVDMRDLKPWCLSVSLWWWIHWFHHWGKARQTHGPNHWNDCDSLFKRNRRSLGKYTKCWCQPTMDEDKSLPCSSETTSKANHVEPGSKRMQQDGDAVVRILAGLQAWVPNMWSPKQPLINIPTGVIAPAEMTQNVSTTKVCGEQLVKPTRTSFQG